MVGKLLPAPSFKAGQLAIVFLKDNPSRWLLPTPPADQMPR